MAAATHQPTDGLANSSPLGFQAPEVRKKNSNLLGSLLKKINSRSVYASSPKIPNCSIATTLKQNPIQTRNLVGVLLA
jgi:hypothetical protein